MHVEKVERELVSTAKARGVAERGMAVSAEQLFATRAALEDGSDTHSQRAPAAIRQVTHTRNQRRAIRNREKADPLNLVGG